ncbi:hypothetical protein O3P69_010638 [Scylla paramamosain]|uniref:NACHT domain-containing protein n=2 Tax=Scylla paramamosain TaxID=85552 RepID=A0AAW0THF9_SCYPA
MASVPPVDYLRFKVMCILEGPGETVLKFILKCGTNSTSPLPFHDYLNNLPQTSTANFCKLNNQQKKKAFNKDEIDKIRDDPSWDTFDITLLYKAIQHACENVAELNDSIAWKDPCRLEGMITEIKYKRNIVVHERRQLTKNEFKKKVSELKDLFVKALEAAQTRYNVPDHKITQEKDTLYKMIQDILKCLTIEDVLRLDTIRQLPVFKKMFVTRLREIYERTQIFDPLCFLSGFPDTHLKVQDIFTNILIKKYPEDLELNYLDIIKFTQSLGQQVSLTFQNTQPLQHPRNTQLQQPFQTTQPPQPIQTTQSPLLSQTTQPPQPFPTTQLPQPFQTTQPPQPFQTPQPPQPFQTTQSPLPSQTTQPPQPFQTTQPPQPFQTTQPPQPFQTTQPTQPFQTAQPPQPFQTTQPPQPFQTTQPPQPFQTTQPPQPFQTTQSPLPSQTTEPPQPFQFTQSPPSHTTQSLQLSHSVDPQFLMIKGVAGSGKTTLLTFILSEWLKDECARRIKYLHEYDFVLHILCRESNCASLEEFLEQVLPQVVAFRPNTQTFFSKSKVLFLIDGLDERNNSSDQLVKDILYRRKLVPESTIVCTSRPEAVVDFLHSVPQEYRKGEGMMEGISLSDRTEFVLKYYDCLGGNGSPNRNRIRQVMRSVGWRDHFRLPLNLLFLATLFHENSDCVMVNITQTSLYVTMHNWSVEKLHYRLAQYPDVRSTSRLSREEGIKKVLDVMYEVALLGVLENRLFLSDQDLRQLKECCKVEKLPWEEVMGAFFSLRQTISVNKTVNQMYQVPHKGLQEFFGAKYITNHLGKHPDSKVKIIKYTFQHVVGCLQGYTSKDIQWLLKNPSRTQLKNFRNLLLHVAGLLSQPDVMSRPQHLKEVVDLLAESGVNTCNDWLTLLEDTEINYTTLERVVKHVIKDEKKAVTVNDSTITSAKVLLPLISPKELNIELHRKESNVHDVVFPHHTYSGLYLWHSFKQPHQQTISHSLLHALPRGLETFVGHLDVDATLMLSKFQHLKYLQLAISDDHDANTILPAIHVACSTLPNLQRLFMHVPVCTVRPDSITIRLPDVIDMQHGFTGVSLVLSGVDETLMERAGRIARLLLPSIMWYGFLMFPGSNMTAEVWRRFLHELENTGVKVALRIGVPYPSLITVDEWRDLFTIARTRNLGGFMTWPEERLWM